ncbi:hypothetical protein HY230_11210 [Candidatus Acetothermia bacterium]|nr:hypothetical protein [Candidatus Acetothermia bacterium]
MTNRKNYSNGNNGVKWIHVTVRGLLGFQTVIVWAGETIEQFKELVGLSPEMTVTVPAVTWPLPDEVELFQFLKDFDRVVLDA